LKKPLGTQEERDKAFARSTAKLVHKPTHNKHESSTAKLVNNPMSGSKKNVRDADESTENLHDISSSSEGVATAVDQDEKGKGGDGDWEETVSDTGELYYFNGGIGETSWEKPSGWA
jgi:hypothetical protein